jgi:hypothetical protein
MKIATLIFIDKKTGICKGGTTWSVDDSLYPSFDVPISSKGYYFITYCYIDEYSKKKMDLLTNKKIPQETVTKLKTLKEDDNPIIVMYELDAFY